MTYLGAFLSSITLHDAHKCPSYFVKHFTVSIDLSLTFVNMLNCDYSNHDTTNDLMDSIYLEVYFGCVNL